jgi:predicted O-methyltransferase YrrM
MLLWKELKKMKESLFGRSKRIITQQGLGMFIKRVWRAFLRQLEPLRIVYYPYARIDVPKQVEKPYTADAAIDFVNKRYGGYIRPSQVRWEIASLTKIVEDMHPKNVLEIGTSRGGTLFIWSRLATKDAHIMSIDLPGGENNWAFPRWKEPFYKTFISKGQHINLLRGDSHSEEMAARFKKVLGNEKLDFLFIDGDHAYEGVKKDYEYYSPFVRPGGVIAFHDVALHPPITGSKVHVFWNEVKQGKKNQEFIENPAQGWGGIGVLFV